MSIDLESPFGIDELFFSRTDLRGIILSGNEVFRRVSEYSWPELIQKPHNYIRHPDMPRGVFHLFWDYLCQQKPIAAYVKNKSKSGKYYWVFALAMPIEGGYLSVRIKPTSQLLTLINNTYQNLKKSEVDHRLSPLQSQETLIKKIESLNFENYTAFMIHALLEELQSRQTQLNKPIPLLEMLASFLKPTQTLISGATTLSETFKGGQFLPLNLEIGASQTGKDGDAIAVVASQYQNSVDEIKNELVSFKKNIGLVLDKISDAQFMVCAGILMSEVLNNFKLHGSQMNTDKVNPEIEIAYLQKLSTQYIAFARQSLSASAQTISEFSSACLKMKQLLLGLEIIRLTGKMEASRLSSSETNFNVLIDQLKAFQGTLLKTVTALDQTTDTLSEVTHSMLSDSLLKN